MDESQPEIESSGFLDGFRSIEKKTRTTVYICHNFITALYQ